MGNGRTSLIERLVLEATGNKPYIFVVMPFGSDWHLFEEIKKIAAACLNLNCIRADDIPGSGFDLLDKIHIAIERAELVVAEISEGNPNVFYELGYAAGIKKQILLLAKRGVEIPTDLRGRELILHSDERSAMNSFKEELHSHLRRRISAQLAAIRDMLEAEKPFPSFIVASPRYPASPQFTPGQMRDRRTFGDNLGILGLLSAFGAIFGETTGVELISGQYSTPDLMNRDHNIYSIGSPKVNRVTEQVMEHIQVNAALVWRFGACLGHETVGNYPVCLYLNENGFETAFPGHADVREGSRVFVEDYGVILRGPHPNLPGRMLTVMAGPHSLGTGAACLAATRSDFIRGIRDMGVDISDRKRGFWVLVRGVGSQVDGLLDAENVTLVRAGRF